jgi:nucleoid-associated protein EbfC
MFGDIGKMMKAAMEMRAKLPEMQAKLATTFYTGQSGDGAVRATVNGRLMLTDMQIDKQVLDGGMADANAVAELVKSAVAAAQEQAAIGAREMMKEMAGGVQIPGIEGMM